MSINVHDILDRMLAAGEEIETVNKLRATLEPSVENLCLASYSTGFKDALLKFHDECDQAYKAEKMGIPPRDPEAKVLLFTKGPKEKQ